MQLLVSICAFEEPSYVSFLVANTLFHTSASTHVVLNYINAENLRIKTLYADELKFELM